MSDASNASPPSRIAPEFDLMRRALDRRESCLSALSVFLGESAWGEWSAAEQREKIPQILESMRQARRLGHSPLLSDFFSRLSPPVPAENAPWLFFAKIAALGSEPFEEALRLWPQEAVDAFSSAETREFPRELALDGALRLARATQAVAPARFNWASWAREMSARPHSWALAESFLREGLSLAPDLPIPSALAIKEARRAVAQSLFSMLASGKQRAAFFAQTDREQALMANGAINILRAPEALPKEMHWREKGSIAFGVRNAMGLFGSDGRTHALALALIEAMPPQWLTGISVSDALGLPIQKNDATRSLRVVQDWQNVVAEGQSRASSLSVAATAFFRGNAQAFAAAIARGGEAECTDPFFSGEKQTINPQWILWSNPREFARNPGFHSGLQRDRIENAKSAIRRHCVDSSRAESLVAELAGPVPQERPPRLVSAATGDSAELRSHRQADMACLLALCPARHAASFCDGVALSRQMQALGMDLSRSASRVRHIFRQEPPAWLQAAQDAAALRGAIDEASVANPSGETAASARTARGLRL